MVEPGSDFIYFTIQGYDKESEISFKIYEFDFFDASPIDCSPYRIEEPWIKRWSIFRYTLGNALFIGLVGCVVDFKCVPY
jgi:hypothetical protein